MCPETKKLFNPEIKKMKSKLTLFAICIFLCSNVVAQEPAATKEISQSNELKAGPAQFKHAINVCPIAPVFGIYSINYEYLISPQNGIVARFEYEAVPNTYTDANIESSGKAFTLNYRRHLKEGMNSIFLGAYTRYRKYKGDGELDSEKFDYTISSYTLGLNTGKRWAWNSGFNIVFSLGYGYSFDERTAVPTNDGIEDALDQLEEEYDFMSPFFGELSIGYAF
jgi:hypothetical protein